MFFVFFYSDKLEIYSTYIRADIFSVHPKIISVYFLRSSEKGANLSVQRRSQACTSLRDASETCGEKATRWGGRDGQTELEGAGPMPGR